MKLKAIGKKVLFDPNFNGYSDHKKLMQILNVGIDLMLGLPFHIMAYATYIQQHGLKSALKVNHKTSELYVLTIIKDEDAYIQEWLLYHYLMGVKNFLIYNNESTDKSVQKITEISQKFSDINIKLIDWPGKSQQRAAYNDAVTRLRKLDCWILTIDADEFLFFREGMTVSKYLNTIPNNVSQVLIGWLIYGSNGYITRPSGLVIDNYKRHAENNYITDYKSLIRSKKAVRAYSGHFFVTLNKTIDAAGKRHWFYPFAPMRGAVPAPKRMIRINHYYDKSREDLKAKIKRGDVFNVNQATRNEHNFIAQDRNEVIDNDMEKISRKLHGLMEKLDK